MEQLKVLIVDDDVDLAKIIMWKLAKEAPEFNIDIVDGGMACLSYLDSNNTDCVLSDYQMPEMSGMDLLRAIRERGDDVPFIFLTGQGNEQVASDAFKAGADDYFTKDVGFAHFTRIVNSVKHAVNRKSAQAKHRQAEEMLSDREERFRAIFESANDAIFLMDSDTFIDCNSKTVEIFGCADKSDIIGHRPYEFSPLQQPDGRDSEEKALELIHKAITGNPLRFYWKHSRKDGSLFDVEVSLNSLVLQGKTYLQAMVRDITAKKQAEDALVREKEFSDAIIRSMPGAFYVYDENMQLVRCNEQYEEAVGGPPKHALEMLAEESRELAETKIKEILEGGPDAAEEIVVVHKDGEKVPSFCTGTHLMVDGKNYLVGVAIDISKRKKLENALAESEERYRTLFNSINDAVFVHDAETGAIIDVNERMCEMFGYSREEAVKLDVGMMSAGEHPYTQEKAVELLARASEGKPQLFEWMARDKSGRLFPVEVNMRLAEVTGRKMVLVTVRDISGREKNQPASRGHKRGISH
jgi:PAS domain S-box-containing protein